MPTKVHIIKAMVFQVVMYRCESWTIKKAKCQRIDALKLWCWRRLLRVPWTARRSNQSIQNESNPECSLEGLMLKLKIQYFSLMWRANSLEKTLMLGKIEGRRRRGWQKMKWLDGTTNSMDMSLSKLPEIVKVREAWRAAVHRVTKRWTRLSDWTTQQSNILHKILQQNISKLNPVIHKRPRASGQTGFHPGMQTWFNIRKPVNVTQESNNTGRNRAPSFQEMHKL